LPHVGHWPQLEDPEGFDAALLEFLARSRVLH
jgi:pimeloyl-ACP methyl ester carboxylesterase